MQLAQGLVQLVPKHVTRRATCAAAEHLAAFPIASKPSPSSFLPASSSILSASSFHQTGRTYRSRG